MNFLRLHQFIPAEPNFGQCPSLSKVIEANMKIFGVACKSTVFSPPGLFKLRKGLTIADKGYRFGVGVRLEDSGRPKLSTTCQMFKIIVDAVGIYKPVFKHQDNPLVVTISSDIRTMAIIAQVKHS